MDFCASCLAGLHCRFHLLAQAAGGRTPIGVHPVLLALVSNPSQHMHPPKHFGAHLDQPSQHLCGGRIILSHMISGFIIFYIPQMNCNFHKTLNL